VNPRVGLDAGEKKNVLPCQESNPVTVLTELSQLDLDMGSTECVKIKKLKLSPQQAVEAYRLVRTSQETY
jgi:hypothetical protein